MVFRAVQVDHIQCEAYAFCPVRCFGHPFLEQIFQVRKLLESKGHPPRARSAAGGFGAAGGQNSPSRG